MTEIHAWEIRHAVVRTDAGEAERGREGEGRWLTAMQVTRPRFQLARF
jgi:hypothetical protein